MASPERWPLVERIFYDALDQPPGERHQFVAARCGDDTLLRRDVESLLAADSSTDWQPSLAGAVAADWARAGPTPPPLPAGTVVANRYRIVRLLGEGGMGAVYEAEDLELSMRVALKGLLPGAAADPRAESRLKREIAVARRVTHPNVCRTFDLAVDRADDRAAGASLLFLTMELIEGETLERRLQARGRLGTGEALPLLRQMAAALAAAHDAEVIHRDFKGANVILTAGRGGERAVVTDFGIAVALEGEDPGAEERRLVGTPAYMAPEQVAGERVGPAADIYALGVVLYEMVTGCRPFAAEDRLAEALARLGGPPPGPRTLVPDLDPRWEAAILRCLEREPAKRFLSASDVVQAVAETAFETGVALLRTVVCVASPPGRLTPGLEELAGTFAGRSIRRDDGWWVIFERPVNAVGFSLGLQEAQEDAAQVGIHLGEVVFEEGEGTLRALRVGGLAAPVSLRLAALAAPGQALISRAAFEVARRAELEALGARGPLRWMAHGSYAFRGIDEPVEVFEVGISGRSPLAAPPDTDAAQRVRGDPTIVGWRPSPGAEIPSRPGSRLLRKLGAGGFGEVWLAAQEGSRERRVFKFCFESERLHALRREVSLFRLLQEALGERDDIARLVSWNFDQAPYFLESEYSEGGGLDAWAEEQGGIARLSLAVRLELLAQAAEALAAAHSVGVLHKDVKPANLLIAFDAEGRPRIRLTDFGIGAVTDPRRFSEYGVTVMGVTVMGMTAASATETTVAFAGTRLYLAPERLEGRPATVQADIYALGVILYQLVVAGLRRSLAPGWERDVEDELLREDIASAVDGSPRHRLGNALRLAESLRSLEARRSRRESERRARAAALRAEKRRRLVVPALLLLAAVAGSLGWGAYTSWTAARRAQAAEAFGRSVEQIESQARYTHLMPLHDVRADYAAIRKRMHGITAEMKTLGDVGYGPGLYALGRGHLVLGEPVPALRELERAWAAGFQAPEVAHALGLAQGQLYQQGLREAGAISDPRLREARRRELEAAHRDPAARWLRLAAAGGAELAVEADGLIAFYEGRLDDALARSRRAAPRPWLYESSVLEGDIHLESARQRESRGAFEEAIAAYGRAGAAFTAAAAVGRSDPQVHERLCLVHELAANLGREATGGDVPAQLGQAEAACGDALAANPERPQALALAAQVERVRGEYLWAQGQDPAPAYERTVAFADRALAAEPGSTEALTVKGVALYNRGAYEFRRGLDPRRSFESAVACLDRVLALEGGSTVLYSSIGNALGYRGEWEISRGLDPRRSLKASIQAFEKGLALDPRYDNLYNGLGVSYDDLGAYEASRGLDATASFESATRAYRQRLALNPNHPSTLNNLGHNLALEGRFERQRGHDPTPLLAAALRVLDRALAQKGLRYDSPYHNRGLVHLELAELALSQGRDVRPHTAAARASLAQAMEINGRNKPWYYADAAQTELLDARYLLATGSSPAAPLAAARRLLAGLTRVYPDVALIHLRLAETAFLDGRWRAASGGRSPEARFREATGELERTFEGQRDLGAAAHLGLELSADWVAYRLHTGSDPSAALTLGDRMAERALEISARMPRTRALVGLHRLARARAAGPGSRQAFLVRAIEDLETALAGDRYLEREFRPGLEEAQQRLRATARH